MKIDNDISSWYLENKFRNYALDDYYLSVKGHCETKFKTAIMDCVRIRTSCIPCAFYEC